LKNWKIFATRYRGPLNHFALVAKTVTALAFYTRPRGRLPLAFGGGPFFCPGSALGKMVIEVGVEALTQRFTPPAAAGSVRWRPALAAAYGPQHLPLVLQER
ncbi:hypothetical protein ABTX79_37145, partial [Streptomyces sp. NPDC096153]